MLDYQYDPVKSKINSNKNGIDFESAEDLWLDPEVLEIPVDFTQELRFLVIGKVESNHWSAVVTYRDEKVRIISVRRVRKNEVALYETI